MAEETVKTEGAAAVQGEQKASTKQKINRLSLNDINSKIEELAKGSHTRSKYYEHLLARRNEIQPS
jgi:hypothetical protein